MPKILRFKKKDLSDYTIKFMEKLGVSAEDAAILTVGSKIFIQEKVSQ